MLVTYPETTSGQCALGCAFGNVLRSLVGCEAHWCGGGGEGAEHALEDGHACDCGGGCVECECEEDARDEDKERDGSE